MILKILSICLLLSTCAFAQREDNTWFLGYPGGNENFGPCKVTFDNGNFQIQKDSTFYRGFYDNNTVISDENGQYLAAFNGFRINDKSGKTMLYGDSIWFDTLPYLYGYSDDDLPQGGMFLPWPDHPDSILLFYTSQGNAAWPISVDLASLNLFYALIRKSGNNGMGAVVERRIEVINDTIQYGRLSATKHANGRDWWILINEVFSNRFYRLLLDPSGVHKLDSQQVSLPVFDGLGQAAFSPDGNFYAIKNAVNSALGTSIDVFRFDRCTGFLSHQYQNIQGVEAIGGVAFSPNSRYLYVSSHTELHQYDLLNDNLDSARTLVGVYTTSPTGLPATFYTMQLAPDNKIYMCATNGIKTLHVIHDPDEAGSSCNFQQSGINLPTYNFSSVTYHPYFRLGPLDGSSCDTLNLDNNPRAWFRYEQDTLNFLSIFFHDLSYFEPANWSWYFDDGTPISHERNPEHQFDSAGIYQVCLTVSNINSTDTHCKTLYLGVSAAENLSLKNQVIISPNPFNNILTVSLSAKLRNPVFRLYNQLGIITHEENLAFGISDINTETLPPGIYFWEVNTSGQKVKTGKVLKIQN